MKKIVLMVLLFVSLSTLGAQSFRNNMYQKMADEYTRKSEASFDNGEYDKAVEYSILAEENAQMSEQYITEMLAKYEANTRIIFAENRIAYAESIDADINYPQSYKDSVVNLECAQFAYDASNWLTAKDCANVAIDLLKDIKKVPPFPKYYIVTDWENSKDCFWNIAGKSAIYNDSTKWNNLYEANKHLMGDASNPDVILPGMKLVIPPLKNEIRDGVYMPERKYEVFGK